jgi:hypothetical protein
MATKAFKFELGQTLRDKVTGFEGVVIARGDHISGCDTYGLQSRSLKDGHPSDSKWFDEPRVELVADTPQLFLDTREEKTGADSVIPTGARSVGR